MTAQPAPGLPAPGLPAPRAHADRCPGLLRPHQAADGALIRLRLPGGMIGSGPLSQVSAVAAEFGDGHVQLTSRGNLQIRGLSTDAAGDVALELIERLDTAGLLPSRSHELVRNIICSPFTGRVGGLADLRHLIVELDEMLCRTPDLAALPGRFLFVLDDGRGDVEPLAHDLGVRALSEHQVRLTVAGVSGPVVALDRAAEVLTTMAIGFLRRRGTGPQALWHVRELAAGGAELLDDLPAGLLDSGDQARPTLDPAPLEFGERVQRDGRKLLSLVVPLGLLTAYQVEAVVAVAEMAGTGRLVVTPWRSLVIPDLSTDVPAVPDVGLSLDPRSGWLGVSACTGAPGCASAAASTTLIAEQLARNPARRRELPVHVVACERRCGSPSTDHVEVLATSAEGAVLSTRRADGTSDGLVHLRTSAALASAVGLARNAR